MENHEAAGDEKDVAPVGNEMKIRRGGDVFRDIRISRGGILLDIEEDLEIDYLFRH